MKPLIKRLPVGVSYRHDILIYGRDNLYPQRIEEIIKRSPITESAIDVTADFLNGAGFEFNGEVKLGELTANEILNGSSKDSATYNSVAFILDVTMEGLIAEVTPVDFRFVRLVPPDKKDGSINSARVSVDWEEQIPVQLRPKIQSFPIWESVDQAKEIIDSWDVNSLGVFPGFILYSTPRKNIYPLCSVDSVLDSSQTNAEIQIFELAGTQNGFLGASLLKHKGKIETDAERGRLEQMVAGMKGAENANSVLIWEVPDGYDGDVLEQFPANDQDKLFESTNKTTVNRIVQRLAIPPSLLGIMPENSFFSMQEIEDAYTYFNVRTENRRKNLARVFKDLGDSFVTPIEFGKIMPQSFIV